MLRLLTRTESLDVTKIARIAYLTNEQSKFLTAKTDRPFDFRFMHSDMGELIADMGKGTPVTLAVLKDELVGSLVVRILTEMIAPPGEGVIVFDDVMELAVTEAAELRASAKDNTGT